MQHVTWRKALVAILAIAGAIWFATFMDWVPPRSADDAPFGAGETVRPPVEDVQLQEEELER